MPNSNTTSKRYAIMRFAKIKSFSALARVCQHNTRAISGENIRKDAPPPMELLEEGSDDFVRSAQARLEELAISRDSLEGKVIAVEIVVTASRGWFDDATEEEKREWLRANVEWAKERFGRGLLTGKLHLDEEVWHIHFVALPVVEKRELPRGKRPTDPVKLAEYEQRKANAPLRWTLSYHDILGGKGDRLSREQDRYHNAVKHLGLKRGEVQRDDVEIEVGNELTISALELSRGYRADGTPRPRRSMSPAEGRAAVKRLRREAELIKRELEKEREQMAAEQAAAAAALAEAKYHQAEAASHLKEAALRNEEAAACLEVTERTRDQLREEHNLAEQQRKALEDDRRALQASLSLAEQERMLLCKTREEAEAELIIARAERKAIEDKREALAAEQMNLQKEKSAFHDRQQRQHDEIELLARGADDQNGLELAPTVDAFVMNPDRMTERERSVYGGRWTSAAARIGHQLALALERIRQLAVDIIRREKLVEAREQNILHRERNADARERQSASAAAELGRQQREQEAQLRLLVEREQDLDRRARALAAQEQAVRQRASAGEQLALSLDRREAEHNAWMAVVTGVAEGTLVGGYREEEGLFRMSRMAKPPTALIAQAISSPPPPWAREILRLITSTMRDQAEAAMMVAEIYTEAESLEVAIRKARSSLPAQQQPSVDKADDMQQAVSERLRRLAALNDRGSSR